jgi:glycosyltransferase involved in cell wall biosynthesis
MCVHTVCHIITRLELGGAQQNTLFTVSHLNETKFHRVLVTGESGILDHEAKTLPNVNVFQVPSMVRQIHPIKDGYTLWKLTALLKRLQPTIVHTHSSKAGILGRLAARLAKVPIVIHSIHGFGFTPHQHPLRRQVLVSAERLASRWTTRFFAVSEANRQQGILRRLFSADKCVVIRSGVDLEALSSTQVDVSRKKRELGLDPVRPVVGTIGPFKRQKAPLDFVRMASRVARARPDVQFVMVGDGELRSEVETELRGCGLVSSVHLLGWRRDVAEILRCLDVFALTSLWEGLPRVYLEALASGVPIVGTRVDGADEVIRDGVNGYLLKPGDVDGLSVRVLQILSNPGELTQNKNSLLAREFDIWEMVRRQEVEYQKLIDSLSSRAVA